jgi:hypothetical protein
LNGSPNPTTFSDLFLSILDIISKVGTSVDCGSFYKQNWLILDTIRMFVLVGWLLGWLFVCLFVVILFV